MEKGKGLSEDKITVFYELIGKLIVLAVMIVLLVRAFLGNYIYAEIDSNALPIISLQYHGSLLMDESDLQIAQKDMPELYNGINTYNDLRSSKLEVTDDGKWVSYYFPIYPLFCLPIKLLFQILHVPQARCFFVTNAILVSFALYWVQKKLKVSAKQRLIAVVLLAVSPVVIYCNYLCYEAFCFSMITLSLVQYSNKKLYSSAFLLSLAGMSNPCAMAMGIVMIAAYFCRMFTELWETTITKTVIRSKVIETVRYAVFYIPCLIPFIFQLAVLGRFIFGLSTVSYIDPNHQYYLTRALMYLFDPSLGYFTFAPLTIIAFFILAVIALIRKDYRSITWFMFLLGSIFAVSLMPHINCGMILCARYLVWIYPVIPIFLATVGYDVIGGNIIKNVVYICMPVVSAVFILINIPYEYTTFNSVTKWILEYFPDFYNPYSATFYCKVLHIDGAYGDYGPAYFTSKYSDSIRKILVKGTENDIALVKTDLIGDESSMKYLDDKLNRIPMDGKYHYINFSALGKEQVRESSPEERGEITELRTLLDETDFSLATVGNTQQAIFPVEIKPHTTYKVEVAFADNFDYETAVGVHLDFYAADYDRGEQEKFGFAKVNQREYTFYIDSGTFDEDSKSIYVRLFTADLENNIDIEKLRMTEMISTGVTERLLINESEIELEMMPVDNCQIISIPINLKRNKNYEIDLTLADDVNFEVAKSLIIDLYAGADYDSEEQQVSSFVEDGKYTYTCNINSGEYNLDEWIGYVRIMTYDMSLPIRIKNLTVTEKSAEQAAQPVN